MTEWYFGHMGESLTYSMKIVARKTGLTPHAIRVWEKRYGAISPARTATNRRLYSDHDLRRLLLLSKATRAGHSIGRIARLANDRLAALVREEEAESHQWKDTEPVAGPKDSGTQVEEALAAARSMNAAALESILTKAAVSLSVPALLERVIAPLMIRLGGLWREGQLRIAQEHLASGIVRTMLGDLLRGREAIDSAPVIAVATPAGQLHEIGALMAAVTAATEGWRVIYLGANLPAEEIAGAVTEIHARAVALSIIYPADDARLAAEVDRLRNYLPDGVAVLVGGRSAENYRSILDSIGVVIAPDLHSLRLTLENLRTQGAGGLDLTQPPVQSLPGAVPNDPGVRPNARR